MLKQRPRICFIGDSFVAGTGDPAYLGWVGRLCQQALSCGTGITAYNLGIRGQTSREIERRWRSEVTIRLTSPKDGVVFAFGVNDVALQGDGLRVSISDSVQLTQTMLTLARAAYQVLFVGPPPIQDPEHNARTQQLSIHLESLCQTLDIPFLDTYTPLSQISTWMNEVAAGDGSHPGSLGYEALAQLIGQWRGWQALLAHFETDPSES